MPRTKAFCEKEILGKAVDLFWKKGYHNTSIQELVNYLGINRASLYDTFGGKQKLFEQALTAYKDENRKACFEFLNSFESIKEGIHGLFIFAIQESLEDDDCKGCFIVNTTTELMPDDSQLVSSIIENKNVFENFIKDYLQKGIDRGELSISLNTAAVATLIYTLFSGLKVVGKLKPKAEELTAMVRAGLAVLDQE